jgi:hypothetical protein
VSSPPTTSNWFFWPNPNERSCKQEKLKQNDYNSNLTFNLAQRPKFQCITIHTIRFNVSITYKFRISVLYKFQNNKHGVLVMKHSVFMFTPKCLVPSLVCAGPGPCTPNSVGFFYFLEDLFVPKRWHFKALWKAKLVYNFSCPEI